MVFLIKRLSDSGYQRKRPVPGARRIHLEATETRRALKRWEIEIASLDELMALSKQCGHSVIVGYSEISGRDEITIFDDYC